jgi:molybdopterin synthase catalytic subunit
MVVHVRLFAGLRERAGTDQVELELPDGASVGEALANLRHISGEVRVVMAVNQEYADDTWVLHPGDELALIPPVSGGAAEAAGTRAVQARPHARITREPLDAGSLREAVRDARAGAIVIFEGTTRDVPELHYEAYAEMAQRKLEEIVSEALARFDLCKAAAEHRIGTVPRSEPSVIVAASAPHRDAAFLGARHLIDEIKATAPIWKKEEGEWVTGTTPEP